MSIPDNRVLGEKYRLVRQLDAGGMGSVWLAEHLSLHSPVAVKLLGSELAVTDVVVQRFLSEACAAASLRSPHVVQILDYGVQDGTPYIVMELLDGETLAKRLRRERCLTPAATDRIVRQVSRAIARAHDAGIVHRDLKPSNIFIVRNEEDELVKLLDFGIAKVPPELMHTPHLENTRTGVFLGSPVYVSPEQAEGARTIDHRTDLWSLGVIAFECLVGHPPFVGATLAALLLEICARPLPVPSERAPVPPGFDAWFARACHRDPQQRFQSAREAAAELGRCLQAELAETKRAPRAVRDALPVGVATPTDELRHAESLPPRDPLHEPGAHPRIASSSIPEALESQITGAMSTSAVTRRRHERRYRRVALAAAGVVILVLLYCSTGRREPEAALGSSPAIGDGPAPSQMLGVPGALREPNTPRGPAPAAEPTNAARVSLALEAAPPAANESASRAPGTNAAVETAPAASARTHETVGATAVAERASGVTHSTAEARPRPVGVKDKNKPASSASGKSGGTTLVAPPKVDCRQPYWIDERGHRRLKMACLSSEPPESEPPARNEFYDESGF